MDKYHKQPLEVENSHWNSQPNRLNSRLHIVQDIFSDLRDKSKSILKCRDKVMGNMKEGLKDLNKYKKEF